MLDAQMIGRFDWRHSAGCLVQQFDHFVGRVGVQPKDLAVVLLGRGCQLQAIDFGFRMGLFVRIDVAFAKTLQANAAHESAAIDRSDRRV